jgi:hypothetical protein
MQHSDATAPTVNPASFATLLAALAAPPKKPASSWNDEALADDVATLSYEHALRAHARYRPESSPASSDDQSLTQIPDAAPSYTRVAEPPPVAPTPQPAYATSPAFSTAMPTPESNMGASHSFRTSRRMATRMERNLLRASVTIRMSEAECEQLHRRAAEAGVTISSYLRSCTFEAEALRAQVKETLAQLRAINQPMKNASIVPEQGTRQKRAWWQRLWPWSAFRSKEASATGRRMAQA